MQCLALQKEMAAKARAATRGQLLMLWPLCDPEHTEQSPAVGEREGGEHRAWGVLPPCMARDASLLPGELELVAIEALLEMTGYRSQGVWLLVTTDS